MNIKFLSILGIGLSLGSQSFAIQAGPVNNTVAYNFIAPSVYGVSNIAAPAIGLIVYDVETSKFRAKGSASSSDWRDLDTAAGGTLAITTKTSAYTVTSADNVVQADATSAAITLTLPPAASVTGRVITIKKTDSSTNLVTVDGNASETIEGVTTTTIATRGETIEIISDGSNWSLLKRTTPSVWQSYTLTIGSNAGSAPTPGTVVVNNAQWRRVGDSMEIMYNYRQSSAGTAGGGTYLFPIPSGYTIDTTKVEADTLNVPIGVVGAASAGDSGRTWGFVRVYDSTNLVIAVGSSSLDALAVENTWAALSNTNQKYSFRAVVPIQGWN